MTKTYKKVFVTHAKGRWNISYINLVPASESKFSI